MSPSSRTPAKLLLQCRKQPRQQPRSVVERNPISMPWGNSSLYSKTGTNTTVAMTTTFLVLAAIAVQQAQLAAGISLFYGATSRQWPAEAQSPLDLLQGKFVPEDFHGGLEEGGDFSAEDYEGVYKFCKFLPLLQKLNKVKQNEQMRSICTQLVELLRPMFENPTAEGSGGGGKERLDDVDILGGFAKRLAKNIQTGAQLKQKPLKEMKKTQTM